MQEKEPLYFKEFRKELKHHLDDNFDRINKKFAKIDLQFAKIDTQFTKIDQKFDKVHEKLDMHFETIGETKVQVTEINLNLKNKASHEYVKDVEKRTEKLEKVVFA